MRLLQGLLLAGVLMGGVSHAQIRGAGATFPSNVYQAWGQGYEAATGKNVVLFTIIKLLEILVASNPTRLV